MNVYYYSLSWHLVALQCFLNESILLLVYLGLLKHWERREIVGKIRSFENKNESTIKISSKRFKSSMQYVIFIRYIITCSSYTIWSETIYQWEKEKSLATSFEKDSVLVKITAICRSLVSWFLKSGKKKVSRCVWVIWIYVYLICLNFGIR